VELGSH